MTLSSGHCIGNFEILGPAGAGGMGEVYRARDTRLSRTVAIKLLPSSLSLDQGLRQRLKREALTISRLNHPHVCTLYDIGHEDGMDYLILEYLEGTPLSARLSSGALPLKEALTIAAQVADGLDAAHRLGIVHRDLKPGNVMITSSGAKLLDFGLAKEHGGPGAAASMVTTRPADAADPVTAEGTILGTLQYMSPEQLHGKPADARSDIFSFGAMLYELVTGEPPFQGKSRASVIASILERDPPPVSERLPIAPKALERLITRCLEKEADARYQNARDVMHDLKWILGGGANDEAAGAAPVKDRSTLLPVLGAVAATIVVVILAARLILGPGIFTKSSPTTGAAGQPTVRATISLPEGHRIAGWASPTVAISDDGSTIAFVTVSPESGQRLYVRPLDATESKLVPESETAEGPVFSPDGKWVLFAVHTSSRGPNPPELRTYSLDSGLTQTLCPVGDYFGADWREDGTIVWADVNGRGLWRIQADGGSKENFLPTYTTMGEERTLVALWPVFLPDGKHMLVSGGFIESAVLDLETGQLTNLGMECPLLRPLPDGRLAWVDRQGTIMVAPFDAAAGRLAGAARAVDRNISIGGAGCAVFAVSGNGTAVFTRGPVQGSGKNLRRVVALEEDGERTPLSLDPDFILSFDLSPDRDRIVLGTIEGLRIHNLRRGGVTELPMGDVVPFPTQPVWSPDGTWIAFSGADKIASTLDVYLVAADGTSPPRKLFKAAAEAYPRAWDPDGESLLVGNFAGDGGLGNRVLRVPLDGGPPEDLGLGDTGVVPALHGDLIAYIQPQGETYSVIVRSYPDLGPALTVASGNYRYALWAEDGSTLYAFDEDGVDAFTLGREPRLTVENQERILSGIGRVLRPAVASGGKGFYALEEVPGAGIITEIEVVVNWVGGLP